MNHNSEIKISVILPVYNAEKYLSEAIESILRQTVVTHEVLVIDDGSTDNSLEIGRRFEPAVEIISQKNKGAGAARNTGIKNASGTHMAFLDADDRWTDKKLEKQQAFLEENPDIDMVFGKVKQFISPELPAEKKIRLKKDLVVMPGFAPGSLLISKTKFMQVGLFDEQLELGEFIDWFNRASGLGLKHHVIDEVFLERRIHQSNMGIYKRKDLKDYTSILRRALVRKRSQNENK